MRSVILAAVCVVVGCVPAEVRDKIAVEAAIHQGYERYVDVAPVESLRAIVRKSGKAWASLDQAVNGD